MRALLVGVALLALTGPAAYAQSGSQEVPPPEMEGPGHYWVFFAFDRAEADRSGPPEFGGFNFGMMAAYDYQFRNAGWDEGILWAGLDLGFRF